MSIFIPSRNRAASLISIATLFAFAVLYLYLSYQYEPKVRAFPIIVGWAMLLFVVLDFLGHTDTALGRFVATSVGMDKPPAEDVGAAEASPVGALIWIPFYGVMVYCLGFLVTAGVYMFISMAVFGRASILKSALWSVFLVAIVYLFFEWALGLRLYGGLLLGALNG